MKKVKIFTNCDIDADDQLEEKINNWIKRTNPIILDQEISTSNNGFNVSCVVLIIYQSQSKK